MTMHLAGRRSAAGKPSPGKSHLLRHSQLAAGVPDAIVSHTEGHAAVVRSLGPARDNVIPIAGEIGDGTSGKKHFFGCKLVVFFYFDFTQLKPTDTWPRDRCGRAQLVLLPSLADFLHLGADL